MELLKTLMQYGGILLIVGVIILGFIIFKSLKMYKKSEDDEKYDELLKQPREKLIKSEAETLAEKYEKGENK